MADARFNDSCIIGLPACGYAFSSARMAFIAAPSDDDFQLEVELLTGLLKEKDYEAFVALQRLDPGKLAFCTKICSKIITAQFCLILLNASRHGADPEVRIPNPNVHLEYGMMLAFKKYVLPFQREGDPLAFNIRPLDTIMYTNSNFRQVANDAIDRAILAVGTAPAPTRAIASSETLLRYLAVRGLQFSDVQAEDGKVLFGLAKPVGFNLLDGEDIVYFGFFDLLSPKELVFRLKLLLQNLHQRYLMIEARSTSQGFTPEQLEYARQIWRRIKVEVLVGDEVDREKVAERVGELTSGFKEVPWKLLVREDLEREVAREYARIGEL